VVVKLPLPVDPTITTSIFPAPVPCDCIRRTKSPTETEREVVTVVPPAVAVHVAYEFITPLALLIDPPFPDPYPKNCGIVYEKSVAI
jgi:hypothetical protein